MAEVPVTLLWTSGWDSTFRLLQLLLVERVPVVPLYLIDPTRTSSDIEMATMARIRAALAERHPETRALLRPGTIVHVADLAPDEEIQRAFNRLAATHGIGSQYGWLARYARQHGTPNIEMACECIPLGASKLLMTRTVPAKSMHGYDTYRVDPAEPDPDVHLVFGGYHYPLIATTRERMVEIAQPQGWLDFMRMTWFCHRPTRNAEPCGLCHPCLANIDEGFGWRIPRKRRVLSAMYRYSLLPMREWARRMVRKLRVLSSGDRERVTT